METTQTQAQKQFEELSTDEQILVTASSKLLKHFRGLESSGLLEQGQAASLIGCVMKIVSIAKSQKVQDRVEKIDSELKK